jgi:uroporphyrin-3 C-methyltransferase
VFALLLALGALGAGGYLWNELKKERQAAIYGREALNSRIETLEQSQQRLNAELGQTRDALELTRSQAQALSDTLQALRERIGQDRRDWTLAEVEYLLLIANRRLQLEGDLATAISALVLADDRLRAQGDPALLPVRRKIAAELQALRAITPPDINGLAVELSSLAESVASLPLAGEAPKHLPQDAQAADETPAGVGDWRGLLKAMWTDIRGLVTIRRNGEKALPLTTPEQRFFLRENLRLKLESARLALLRDAPATYRAALDEADAWLARFYDGEAPAVAAAREQLQRQRAVELAPQLPAIDGSLRTLRDVIERLEKEARKGQAAEAEAESGA